VRNTGRPTTPEALRDQISAIFPSFRKAWDSKDNPFIQDDGTFSYHGVMLALNDHFAELGPLSEVQIEGFSALLNSAVTTSDVFENAVSTCFLEHMHQMKLTKVLGPHLTREAKKKSHA
jgi:hypothetical protein